MVRPVRLNSESSKKVLHASASLRLCFRLDPTSAALEAVDERGGQVGVDERGLALVAEPVGGVEMP